MLKLVDSGLYFVQNENNFINPLSQVDPDSAGQKSTNPDPDPASQNQSLVKILKLSYFSHDNSVQFHLHGYLIMYVTSKDRLLAKSLSFLRDGNPDQLIFAPPDPVLLKIIFILNKI